MKKSTKIISICSILGSVILLLIGGIVVFITSQNKTSNNTQNEITNYSTDNYNFFNKTKINSGNRISLNKFINKKEAVLKLTNYLNLFNFEKLSFDNNLINKNILSIITNTISKIKSFEKINDFYINIKFEIIYNNLILDIRWANKNDILNNKKTALYWDQLKLTI